MVLLDMRFDVATRDHPAFDTEHQTALAMAVAHATGLPPDQVLVGATEMTSRVPGRVGIALRSGSEHAESLVQLIVDGNFLSDGVRGFVDWPLGTPPQLRMQAAIMESATPENGWSDTSVAMLCVMDMEHTCDGEMLCKESDRFCNGVIDCPGGTDELRCDTGSSGADSDADVTQADNARYPDESHRATQSAASFTPPPQSTLTAATAGAATTQTIPPHGPSLSSTTPTPRTPTPQSLLHERVASGAGYGPTTLYFMVATRVATGSGLLVLVFLIAKRRHGQTGHKGAAGPNSSGRRPSDVESRPGRSLVDVVGTNDTLADIGTGEWMEGIDPDNPDDLVRTVCRAQPVPSEVVVTPTSPRAQPVRHDLSPRGGSPRGGDAVIDIGK